eukprot:TRINITY_DN10223_c0_g1_i2.p1 TRINITY_DN10223_c0_g1~~TRINITY_DN10223_c0_g1_i2.p1  ORF type:complete len:573 (-),score=129.42 TRINITY_DN10223_c0_g1_i2:161-1834(-)
MADPAELQMARINEQLAELQDMLRSMAQRMEARQAEAHSEISRLRTRLLDSLSPAILRRADCLAGLERRLAVLERGVGREQAECVKVMEAVLATVERSGAAANAVCQQFSGRSLSSSPAAAVAATAAALGWEGEQRLQRIGQLPPLPMTSHHWSGSWARQPEKDQPDLQWQRPYEAGAQLHRQLSSHPGLQGTQLQHHESPSQGNGRLAHIDPLPTQVSPESCSVPSPDANLSHGVDRVTSPLPEAEDQGLEDGVFMAMQAAEPAVSREDSSGRVASSGFDHAGPPLTQTRVSELEAAFAKDSGQSGAAMMLHLSKFRGVWDAPAAQVAPDQPSDDLGQLDTKQSATDAAGATKPEQHIPAVHHSAQVQPKAENARDAQSDEITAVQNQCEHAVSETNEVVHAKPDRPDADQPRLGSDVSDSDQPTATQNEATQVQPHNEHRVGDAGENNVHEQQQVQQASMSKEEHEERPQQSPIAKAARPATPSSSSSPSSSSPEPEAARPVIAAAAAAAAAAAQLCGMVLGLWGACLCCGASWQVRQGIGCSSSGSSSSSPANT